MAHDVGQGSFDELAPELFTVATVDTPTSGYRVPAVLEIVGVTYRQLDYWARTGLVTPSVQAAAGSGSQRLYSFRDILALKIVKRLLDAGISLRNIRTAVKFLAIAVGHTLTDLAGTVHQFPAEDATPTAAAAVDDLAQRRNAAVSEAV